MADEADDTADKFTMKIKGPGMNFEREIDASVIPNLMQLALGGGQVAAAVPPVPSTPSAWQRGADPRVDLNEGGSPGKPQKAAKKTAKKAGKKGAKKLKVSATKGINFAQSGKTSWNDFAAEKKPSNNWEKAWWRSITCAKRWNARYLRVM